MFEIGKTYPLKDGYSFTVIGYNSYGKTLYDLVVEPYPKIDPEATSGFGIVWFTVDEETYLNWEYRYIKKKMRKFRKIFRECYPEFCL